VTGEPSGSPPSAAPRSGDPFPGALRIGQGLDMHRFATATPAGRPLILGGVVIPGAPGLVGHSDGDAVAHALADAVLGASGLGDLGRHFPDSDPVWAGADSLGILAEVVAKAADAGWYMVNADCTVVAEAPRLAPYVDEMAHRLGAVVAAPVSVKATRAESLGALGRVEGLGCLTVVLMTASGVARAPAATMTPADRRAR